MRLHTSVLTESDIRNAARKAGVHVEHVARHGSRTASHAFEVALSGSGVTGGQWGGGGYRSATWDEWGIFLAELYRVDPAMVADAAYRNGEHFAWATGDRYATLRPADQHLRHKWAVTGWVVTGSYQVQECRCGAMLRCLAPGYTWEAVSSLV